MTLEEKAREYVNNYEFTKVPIGEQYVNYITETDIEEGYLAGAKNLEQENAELKDLIKNIIRVTWGEGWNYSLDWKVKAEQFLKGDRKMTLEEKADKLAEDYVMREDTITENDRVPFDNGYGFQTVDFEKEVKKGYKDGYLECAKELEQEDLKSKLAKATEIIKGLCDLIHWKHGYFHKEIIDAEKFLDEIDKE